MTKRMSLPTSRSGEKATQGVAAGGGGDLLQGDLLQQLAPGGGLLALGLVGGEAGDELLELLGLSSFFLFWFFIRFCISWEASYQKSCSCPRTS